MKRYKNIAGDGGSNISGQVEAQQAKLKFAVTVAALVLVARAAWGRGESRPGARPPWVRRAACAQSCRCWRSPAPFS